VEKLKWKMTKYGRDCTFRHKGQKYAYINTENGYDIFDDEFNILASSDKRKRVIGFPSEDLTFLYQLATELEIQFIQLDNGMIFYPDSAYGWVQDSPTMNIVNLARLASRDEYNVNNIFYILDSKAYIDGKDVTDILVRETKMRFCKNWTMFYGIKHRFSKCTIFSELQAGFRGDYLEEFLKHLYSEDKTEFKINATSYSSKASTYIINNSFIVQGFKFSSEAVSLPTNIKISGKIITGSIEKREDSKNDTEVFIKRKDSTLLPKGRENRGLQ
jgi:hypothetical protein